ncbi:hypothetical protein ACWCP6_17950 [Streptomyces sp. NPDC002004]
MSDHDIQLLGLGICIGVYLMLFSQIIGGALDDRRDRKAARTAEAKLAAARERAEA